MENEETTLTSQEHLRVIKRTEFSFSGTGQAEQDTETKVKQELSCWLRCQQSPLRRHSLPSKTAEGMKSAGANKPQPGLTINERKKKTKPQKIHRNAAAS